MEERLVSEYIGKDADKFMDGKINWTAAILGQAIGPVWFFFRKSYLLGFAFLVVTYIVGSIASAMELKKASYIMFFIYLFTANKLYLWDVRRKVNNIASSGYASDEELISTVREKGGTSTVAAVINYQRSRGLTVDGIIGCNTWLSLQEDVLGRGITSTTID